MLRSDKTPAEAAKGLGLTGWFGYKWREHYRQAGWEGRKDQSRAPHCIMRKTREQARKAILRMLSELEAESLLADRLFYIGEDAILRGLRSQGMISPLGISTIERIFRQAG